MPAHEEESKNGGGLARKMPLNARNGDKLQSASGVSGRRMHKQVEIPIP